MFFVELIGFLSKKNMICFIDAQHYAKKKYEFSVSHLGISNILQEVVMPTPQDLKKTMLLEISMVKCF